MTFVSSFGSDDDFMQIAFAEALKSTDPSAKAGACIVNKKREILGKGFNRFPKITKESADPYPWSRECKDLDDWKKSKYAYILYSEIDAITNCPTVDECTLYTLLYPSNVGAQLIVEKGIKKVVYYSDKHRFTPIFEVSKLILESAEVDVEKFQPKDENKAYFDKMADKTVRIEEKMEC